MHPPGSYAKHKWLFQTGKEKKNKKKEKKEKQLK